MQPKKLISKKSPQCSLIVRLSFTWQKHINAENGGSNGYNGYTDICTFIKALLYIKKLFI
jgi:hypothetical protein